MVNAAVLEVYSVTILLEYDHSEEWRKGRRAVQLAGLKAGAKVPRTGSSPASSTKIICDRKQK